MSTDNSKQPHQHHALLKSSGIVACGVLASRVLGFVRDVILARFLGTGFLAEAFFVAQRIPNLLRDMVGEGAANAAIVPVLSEYAQKRSKEEWLECINAVLAWGVIILGGITVIGIFAAPWIVRLIAPGFAGEPGEVQLTVDLTRIMFPYLILIALTAFQAGILYSLNAFFAPAFGPVPFEFSHDLKCLGGLFILMAVGLCDFRWCFDRRGLGSFGPNGRLYAVGEFIGKCPLALIMRGPGRSAGFCCRVLWGSTVYQINIFVDTFCASLAVIVGAGGIAAIYYANRMIQFPLGVFGYALSSVALPSLSKLAQEQDMVRFRSTLIFALRNLMLILIPTAIAMVIFSTWIIHIVFQRGAFDAYSAHITSQVMLYAALGLPFFGASRIMVSAFYALQDTKTPVKAATVCLVINIVLNAALMFPMKIGGIALASTIAGAVNCYLLWNGLNKKLSWR